MNAKRRSALTASIACVALLAVTATVGAATITGTGGNDTLRGGARADKLNGKGGNDKLFGAGGNDVLAGGGGNDLLVGGPGADRLLCGAGSDIARGDANDAIAADCEKVLGVPKVTISIADATAAEGNSGTTTLSFSVSLAAASSKPVSVQFATADGTATAPADYAAASGTLTFAPGQKTKAIAVGVVADLAIEQDETFSMRLSNPVNASIANGAASGLITNDDTSVPVTVGTYRGLLEGNFIFFDVNSDRTISGFRSNYIREDCNGNLYVYGTVSWGPSHRPIAADGTFAFGGTSNGTIGGTDPATFTNAVTGRFDGTNAIGTYTASAEFDYQGTHYRCTSGTKPWSASLQT
jgi:Calx-beta domain/RTX calcium-binding nonapeptide repeat (4 copies)